MNPTLILHEDQDLSALWLADRFRSLGQPVLCVSGSDLANARHWHHRLGQSAPSITIALTDGREIGSDWPGGIINRLVFLPHALQMRLGGDDGDYARQEVFALFLSWLTALTGTMINRPTPQGLSGAWRHPSHWTALASTSGLPVRPWRQADTDDSLAAWEPVANANEAWVYALRKTTIDRTGLPSQHRAAAQRLVDLAGVSLLGLGFEPDGQGGWQFVRATVVPDLIAGGDLLVTALLEGLRR